MTAEALEAIMTAYDPKVQAVRPHQGQIAVAANMRNLLDGSEIIANATHGRVQDAYSLRCIPQIHGATRDALAYVKKAVETEINAVTDNPILFVKEGEVISGGNFHGQPMALAFDFLGIAVAELANIAERRIERLVNPALSGGLPAFLSANGGLNSGFMICQYCAASLVSENKILASPACVDSIPSSANQEDHVSMGTIAARKAQSIVENTRSVLAIELLCAAQGIDMRGGQLAIGSRAAYQAVRKEIAYLDEDRELRLDIEKAQQLIKEETVLTAVYKAIGGIH
jgi:histidine ammonia-lyase